MSLAPATRLGAYEIVTLVGAGGMGEVYRARDTRLKRDVALKILPESFAADPERLARFQREAEVLASLNHPHIAAIYGLEQSDLTRALVMELVEGETLADRIVRGAIPVDEALRIARQIAEALEAAHEQGIIHRDLKPANIKLRSDGTVKVLDFGLAKLVEPAGMAGAGGAGLSMSPTITSPAIMSSVGTILGTAAYMSPEQAVGKTVDKRADVWAFGVVLMEMLTGQQVFSGETVSHVLASILKDEPNWRLLPASTPPSVVRLLQRCLEKDPKRRLRDVGDVALDIDAASNELSAGDSTSRLATRSGRIPMAGWMAAGLLMLTLIVVAWLAPRAANTTFPRPLRFALVPPDTAPFSIQGFYRNLAIAPDGSYLVYVAGAETESESRLMVRRFDQLDPVALPGITNAQLPFISPDGRWVGFFAPSEGQLKKVAIAGGPAITVCPVESNPRGASWGADDRIVFATNDLETGLMRVSASGGQPEVLTSLDKSDPGFDHLFPSLLPGDEAVLFTATGVGGINKAELAVLDLKTGQRKTIVRGGIDAEYIEPFGPDQAGFIVYGSAGALRAIRFDPRQLEVLSEPVTLVEHVETLTSGAAEFRVSRQGTLIYVGGEANAEGGAARSLVWVSRDGREEALGAPPDDYWFARVSPDNSRLAVSIRRQELSDIWMWDLARRTMSRLTHGPEFGGAPIWTRDSRHILYVRQARAQEDIRGEPQLFRQAADGGSERELLGLVQMGPYSLTPDNRSAIALEINPKTGFDLVLLRFDRAGKPTIDPLVRTDSEEMNGEISPDGRWLAYYSNESGRPEIYVRPFPNVNAGRWQISTAGGTRPVWSRDAQELYYLGPSTEMMAVSIRTSPAFSAGTPTKLFDGPWYAGTRATRSYDVASDGRFLMIKDAAVDNGGFRSPTITVVTNWFEELKQLVAAR